MDYNHTLSIATTRTQSCKARKLACKKLLDIFRNGCQYMYIQRQETGVQKIAGFDKYLIDSHGNIFSIKRAGVTKKTCRAQKGGYLLVNLYQKGKPFTRLVHRLVAETFIPNPENKKEVNHKNGIRTDNRVENLEWVTSSENVNHSYCVLHRKGSMTGKHGENNPLSKKVIQIKNGCVIGEFDSSKEAEKATGVFATNIIACCRGRYKTSGGFVWRHK